MMSTNVFSFCTASAIKKFLKMLTLLWRHGGRVGGRQRAAARVGTGMRERQAGQVMVRVIRARSWRRASGRLRPGGKDPRRGGGVALGGAQEGVRPDQADQRQVAVEARPGAPLVVA